MAYVSVHATQVWEVVDVVILLIVEVVVVDNVKKPLVVQVPLQAVPNEPHATHAPNW